MTLAAILLLVTLVIVAGIECVLAVREEHRLADEWEREYPPIRYRSIAYPKVVEHSETAFEDSYDRETDIGEAA